MEMTGDAQSNYGVAPPNFRLPGETRLGAVRLQVANLDRSLVWYREVLGLRVLEKGEAAAVLGSDEGVRLVSLRESPGALPVPPRARLGLFHYAILLSDRPALGRFVKHLARLGVAAGASDHEVSEAIYLSDPDGLGIEVYADRPRAAWRARGRELVMTTAPLDLRDVEAAAGNDQWTGMRGIQWRGPAIAGWLGIRGARLYASERNRTPTSNVAETTGVPRALSGL